MKFKLENQRINTTLYSNYGGYQYEKQVDEDVTNTGNIELDHLKSISNDKKQYPNDETSICQRFINNFKSDDDTQEQISYIRLFRFATKKDMIYLIFAIISSLILGITIPLSMIIFGDSIDSFINRTIALCSLNLTAISNKYCPAYIQLTQMNFYSTLSLCNSTGLIIDIKPYDLPNQVRNQIISALIIGCIALICGYIRTLSFNILSNRQARIIRKELFHSIIHKDIEFFDQYKTGELSICLTDGINKIQEGIGEKFGIALEIISTFLSCITIGFSRGWKLALVVLSTLPIIFLAIILSEKIIHKMISRELKAYEKAGAIAEEVISAIRTVFSYNGQNREIQRYERWLDEAKYSGIKKHTANGIANGAILFLIYCIFTLGFWYGAKLVHFEEYTIGSIFTVFINIYMGVLSLEQASPFFHAISQARVAASIVWNIIDEPKQIHIESKEMIKTDSFNGDIRFSDVCFSYPSRPEILILNSLSLDIQFGETVALVGSSGSGKSTCIQLLQRIYSYQSGSIELDGKELNRYDYRWLRNQIGVVNQEPILFQMTIRENIMLGCSTATNEDVYRSAKLANAHDFIMSLPDRYETKVGERGTTLSGGQKQRIAIARALIRNPKILLFDEATSALDNESEKIVQEALDRASRGRTTIIIAHRLSTIRYANKIIVLDHGRAVEQGTHDYLMNIQGVYYNLVKTQNSSRYEFLSVDERENLTLKEQRESLGSSASSFRSAFSLKIKSIHPEVTKLVEDDKSSSTWSILKYNKSEWLFILIGCIAALINGALEPTSGIVQTKLVTAFEICDIDKQKEQVLIFSLIFIAFGIAGFFAQSLQTFMFGCSGEALTKHLRSQIFRSILRQDFTYFDRPEHNTGVLCTYLATEASAVQGASGVRLGLMLQNGVTIGAGIIIGFCYSWQLTLLVIVFLPLIIFGATIQVRLIARFDKQDQIYFEKCSKIVTEVIQNIRTVVQLSKEEYFYQEYSQILDNVYNSLSIRLHILSGLYAIITSIFFFTMAVLLSVGARLVNQDILTFQDFFIVFDSVVLTARIASQSLTLSPDYGKALRAAGQIFSIINRQSNIDNCSTHGKILENFQGNLKFDDISFSYPIRTQTKILKNFQLNIKSGQKVAFVGSSGCGKSTIIQLIERFYDPNSGQLLVDSTDLRTLNLQWYRSQIGIVSQEPILFDRSIRENIAYGDTNRLVIPIEEIIQAAKNANIHDFIEQLPDGYETRCGAKGIQLSGGQKQRIAIARALIRNPKILLLDEATSALDAESEQIVQETLDHAQEHRTSITIAHRLSTIEKADLIYVIDKGTIIEYGTHEELLNQRGRYYQLVLRSH